MTAENVDSKQIREIWDQAKAGEPHPHLTRLGIEESQRLRVVGDTLLVPMWHMEHGLANLQLIGPDGRSEYLADTIEDMSVTFGRLEATEEAVTVYICTSWPSAYAINALTGSPACAAFRSSSLLPVARSWLRILGPDDRLIVAADNDRWSYTEVGGWKQPNPGVRYAREAAQAIGGAFVIPDFVELNGRPISYNDLRLREGPEAVLWWLDPQRAESVRTRLEGHDVLDAIVSARVHPIGQTVAELVCQVVNGQADASENGMKLTHAIETAWVLREASLLVTGNALLVANRRDSLQRQLEERWPDGEWKRLLRELPGARGTPPKYFTTHLTGRTTMVPLDLLPSATGTSDGPPIEVHVEDQGALANAGA